MPVGGILVLSKQSSLVISPWFNKIRCFLYAGLTYLLVACNLLGADLPTTGTSQATQSTQPQLTRLPPSHTPATPESTATSQQTINLSDADLRGTIIHFWHTWNGEGGQVIKQLVDEFNLTNRWRIVVVPLAFDSFDQLYAQIDSAQVHGNPPDLVTAYLHQAQSWDASITLVDLQPYLNDPAWGMSAEEQADFYPVFWQQDLLEGKRLGIPAQRSGQLLYYNRSWAEELGYLSPPGTTSTFAKQACASVAALREEEDPANDREGGWIISGGDHPNYSATLAWIASFGGKIYEASIGASAQRSPYRFDTTPVEKAFTFLRGLYDDDCARFAAGPDPESEFANRLALFATGSLLGIPAQVAAFNQAGSHDQWTVIPFPTSGSNPAISVYGPSFQILTTSPKEQLAAWILIRWLTSPENQARLVQVTGAFPLRQSMLALLESFQRLNPQWAAAVELLPYAVPEPTTQSWETVRWALSDASTQLFRYYFTIDQVPNLLALLDHTATELHLGPDLDEVFATPQPATRTATP